MRVCVHEIRDASLTDSTALVGEGAERARGGGGRGAHVRVGPARAPHVQRALVRHAAHQRAGRVEVYTVRVKL